MRDDSAPAMLWPEGDAGRACEVGEVQVWCWSLQAAEAEAEALCGGLSGEERARAGRFVYRRDWRRYVMAHAGMRRVLGGCLGRRGEEVVLGAGSGGKPYMVGGEGGGSGLGFNLTHSGNLAALAVGRGMEVGVDVEEVRTTGTEHPVDVLSAREQAYLRGLPREEQAMGFYRCWTRKEALLKGVGIGLMGDPGSFSVLPGWDRAEVSVGTGGLAGWRLRELVPAVGFVGCLALPGESFAVRCFRLG